VCDSKAIAVSASKAVSNAVNWLSKDVPHYISASTNNAVSAVLKRLTQAVRAGKAIAVSASKALSSTSNWISKDVPHCIAAAADKAVSAVFRLLPKAVRTAVKQLRWAASSISQVMPCTTWLLVSSTHITWAGFNIICAAMFKAVHAAAAKARTAVSTAVKQLRRVASSMPQVASSVRFLAWLQRHSYSRVQGCVCSSSSSKHSCVHCCHAPALGSMQHPPVHIRHHSGWLQRHLHSHVQGCARSSISEHGCEHCCQAAALECHWQQLLPGQQQQQQCSATPRADP
jgi:hypothetical protein